MAKTNPNKTANFPSIAGSRSPQGQGMQMSPQQVGKALEAEVEALRAERNRVDGRAEMFTHLMEGLNSLVEAATAYLNTELDHCQFQAENYSQVIESHKRQAAQVGHIIPSDEFEKEARGKSEPEQQAKQAQPQQPPDKQ